MSSATASTQDCKTTTAASPDNATAASDKATSAQALATSLMDLSASLSSFITLRQSVISSTFVTSMLDQAAFDACMKQLVEYQKVSIVPIGNEDTKSVSCKDLDDLVGDASATISDYLKIDALIAKRMAKMIVERLTQSFVPVETMKRLCECIGMIIGGYTVKRVFVDAMKGKAKQARAMANVELTRDTFREQFPSTYSIKGNGYLNEILESTDCFDLGPILGPIASSTTAFKNAAQDLANNVAKGSNTIQFKAKLLDMYWIARRQNDDIRLCYRAMEMGYLVEEIVGADEILKLKVRLVDDAPLLFVMNASSQPATLT